jgi:hypothetical protein
MPLRRRLAGNRVHEVRHCRLSNNSLSGTAFTSNKNADALEHLGGGTRSLGQEDIGADSAVGGVDCAGDDHGGQRGVELLGATDKLVAVHLGHRQVAKEKVDRTWRCLLNLLKRLLRGRCLENAIAASFEEEGADGEYLFVGVDAEDDLLRAHAVSVLPVTP